MSRPPVLIPPFGLPADVRRALRRGLVAGFALPLDRTYDRLFAQLGLEPGGPMTTVTYVGPFDEVEFQQGDLWRTTTKGEAIDVPDDVAGAAPSKDDPGRGLLAQVDNWAAKPPTKKPPTKTADAAEED